MELTREEQGILAGKQGALLQKAMQILKAVGDVYEAPGMVPVHLSHISGANHQAMGPAVLELVEEMASTGCRIRSSKSKAL